MESSQSKEYYKLSNGLLMPVIGLGTYQIKNSEVIAKAIGEAGYRHLDTAFVYENE
jgi:diketogulonate reductase-like aldo/keto reductase